MRAAVWPIWTLPTPSTFTSCLRCGGEAELKTYGSGVSGVGATAVVLKRAFSRPSNCYRLQVGKGGVEGVRRRVWFAEVTFVNRSEYKTPSY
jgi:hypothetical protein